MKRIIPLLFFCLCAGACVALQAQGYNAGELAKLRAFLLQPSETAGVTNAEALEIEDMDDPSAWTGITWNEEDDNRVTGIEWSMYGLSGNLDVSGFTELWWLECADNSINSLKFDGDVQLAWLDCENNALTSLDVTTLTALEDLYCSGNDLEKVDLSGCGRLTSFIARETGLTRLDLSGCPELIKVDVTGNKLISLDAASNPSLKELLCNENRLTSITLNGNDKLNNLLCRNNQLTDLELSGCPNVKEFFCDDNLLTELNVNGLLSLESLKCEGNNLVSLDVSGCPALMYLYCGNNRLSRLETGGHVVSASLYCDHNYLTLETLPPTDGIFTYQYAPQNIMELGFGVFSLNKTLDLSAQIRTGNQGGGRTTFAWYSRNKLLQAGEDYTEDNGTFVFTRMQNDSVYCKMSHSKFIAFEFSDRHLTTSSFALQVPSGVTGPGIREAIIYKDDMLQIEAEDTVSDVIIYDMQGRLLAHCTLEGKILHIPLRAVTPVLLVKLIYSGGSVVMRKVVTN